MQVSILCHSSGFHYLHAKLRMHMRSLWSILMDLSKQQNLITFSVNDWHPFFSPCYLKFCPREAWFFFLSFFISLCLFLCFVNTLLASVNKSETMSTDKCCHADPMNYELLKNMHKINDCTFLTGTWEKNFTPRKYLYIISALTEPKGFKHFILYNKQQIVSTQTC